MNTIAGKPLALALLLAAGLLVALFAAGVFTPRGAQAQVTAAMVMLEPSTAGANSKITVTFTVPAFANTNVGDPITLKLEDFGLPSTINPSTVLLRDDDFTGPASDVSVSSSTITVTIPDMNPTDNLQSSFGDDGDTNIGVTMIISARAGITNPSLAKAAGEYKAEVNVADAGAVEVDLSAITRTLTISPDKGKDGTEITVSGKGYNNGAIQIYRFLEDPAAIRVGTDTMDTADPADDVPILLTPGSTHNVPSQAKKIGDSNVSGNSFSLSLTIDKDDFGAGGDNWITGRDSDGAWSPLNKRFNLTPRVILPSEVTRGKDLTIKLREWSYGQVTEVRVGGDIVIPVLPLEYWVPIATATSSDGFKVTIPASSPLGNLTVKVTGQSGNVSGSVEVKALSLTIQPSTAVVGQSITVTGEGFHEAVGPNTNAPENVINSIMVGGATVPQASYDRNVASGGRVVVNFVVPDHASLSADGDYTVRITDGGGRQGSATLTIPKETISITPTESRIGSVITVSCAGFPVGASKLVTIKYDGTTRDTTTTDSAGNCVSVDIEVPNDAGVGESHKVRAEGNVAGDADAVNVEVDHKTPKAVVSLSADEASRGSILTISGANFNTFRPVKIEIGDSLVTPSPAPTTDRDGAFSADVLVPGVSLGNRNVRVTVNNVPVVENVRITDNPVIQTPAQVFGALGDALRVVWYYNNATQSWNFYNPAPAFAAASDLTEIPSGISSYDVHLNEAATFNGVDYPAGWVRINLSR